MSSERAVPSVTFQRIATSDRRALESLMVQGGRPALDALPGWEYRGMNLGLVPRLLGIQTFLKGFRRLPDGGVGGYNVRVRQNGPVARWQARPVDAARRHFGFYRVTPVNPTARDNAYPQALLLDYGQGGNRRLHPLSTLRDYLVRVTPGADELLLGKAFIALGRRRVPVGYFLLERHRRSEDGS